jgi:dimethylargininase
MATLIALTRDVSPAMACCELTYLPRVPIDVAVARAQHGAYERALERLGCAVLRLPSGADMPDAVFVEDTAVVLDEVAIIARPAVSARRAEVAAVEERIREWRPVAHVEAPGTLEGGDVIVAGRSVFAGLSRRTNAAGVEQLRRIVAQYGYSCIAAPVHGCLHLKSAASAASPQVLVVNPEWIDARLFSEFDVVAVDPREPGAANVLRIGAGVLCAAACPRTMRRLEEKGLQVVGVDVSELAKAEGAVTCCSLVFSA